MCVGVPMRIIEADGLVALAEADGRRECVSLALTGAVEAGAFVLVYLGSAVRILDAEEARRIAAALEAVARAAEGADFEHLLQDLIDREPTLPVHLRDQQTDKYCKPEESHGRVDHRSAH